MTQTSCKRETKSRSHPGMKLAPVRVFPCKHPLKLPTFDNISETERRKQFRKELSFNFGEKF